MNRKLSLSQRIHNCVACSKVEEYWGLHTYYHSCGMDHIENQQRWTRRADSSWSHAFGRERGANSCYYNNCVLQDARVANHYLKMYLHIPQIGGVRNMRALYEASVHVLATDIMEVADDGMSLRATFMTPGLIFSSLNTNDPTRRRAMYIWERYSADFVYENGDWFFLRNNVRPDQFGAFDGSNPGRDIYDAMVHPDYEKKHHGGNYNDTALGMPNIIVLLQENKRLHEEWTPITPVQDATPIPMPYRTLDRDNTYDPGAEDYPATPEDFNDLPAFVRRWGPDYLFEAPYGKGDESESFDGRPLTT